MEPTLGWAIVSPVSTLRLLEMNAWVGQLVRGIRGYELLEPKGRRALRHSALARGIVAAEADVVTLQEVVPLPGAAQEIAAATGYDLLWRVNNGGLRLGAWGIPPGVGRGAGLAILARPELGLTAVGVRRLSGPGLVTNWMSAQAGPVWHALAGLIHVGDRPLVIVNTHVRYAFPDSDGFFHCWEKLRAQGHVDTPEPPAWLLKLSAQNRLMRDHELDRLATWLHKLSQRHEAPVLLGADFNHDPDTAQMRWFTEATGFLNALPTLAPGSMTWQPNANPNVTPGLRHTWKDGTPKPPPLQLMTCLDSIAQCPDHVLCSPELTPVAAQLTCTRPHDGIYASDHFGVLVDIEL